jgi:hypothetical protein
MKRSGMAMVAALLVVCLGALALAEGDAGSRRRGRDAGAEAAAPEPTAPNPNIVALLNGLTWGMNKDQVITAVKQEIRDKYWAQIQAASDDGVAEQRLRTRMEREQEAFAGSCVSFTGQQTPWNVSMVDTEFTHNNQEEMCKFDRGDATDFYFFIRGKLWKIFRALNAGEMASAPPSLDDMRAQMEAQFGPAEELRQVNQYYMTNELVGVRWVDSQTDMQLRWLELYGVFAVVLTDRATLGNLASLRRNTSTPGSATEVRTDGLTQAVTEGTAVDENSDIVERLSGQRPDPTAPPPTPPPSPPQP